MAVQIIFANLRSENEFGKMMRSGIETLKSVLSEGNESEVCYMAIHVLFFRMMTGLCGEKDFIQTPKSSVVWHKEVEVSR